MNISHYRMKDYKLNNEKCAGCSGVCMKSLNIISRVDESKLQAIISSAIRRKKRKNSYLFREGDPCDGIYVLLSGKIKLCTYDGDGREEIAGIFWAGEVIWEGLFIEGSTYPYDAVCLDTTDCCMIPRDELESLLKPKAFLRISKSMIVNLRKILHVSAEPGGRLMAVLLNGE